jgi:hypothetical protein
MKLNLILALLLCYSVVQSQTAPCDIAFFKDDQKLMFDSINDIENVRLRLIKYAFGDRGLPKEHFNVVPFDLTDKNDCDIADPIEYYKASTTNWRDLMFSLKEDMDSILIPSFQDIYEKPRRLKIRLPLLKAPDNCKDLPEYSTAYYFVSKKKSSGRAVLLHQGHYSRINDAPNQKSSLVNRDFVRILYSLLSEGTDVALILMPNSDPCFGTIQTNHACIWNSSLKTGSPLQVFLTPSASMMAYLSDTAVTMGRRYKQFHMIGLSGGGLLTTIYSAMDVRIKTSISVAGGMMPFYLYGTNPITDLTDLDLSTKSIFTQANPQDYYFLASYGKGRNYFEVWLRNDDGGSTGEKFFYGKQPNHPCNGRTNIHQPSGLKYDEARVEVEQRVIKRLAGSGKFEIIIDDPVLKTYDSFQVRFKNYGGAENYVCPSTGCHLISQGILVHFLNYIGTTK